MGRPHGAKAAPEVLKMTDEIRMTRYAPAQSGYELLLYAVKGSGHRLPSEPMAQAIDYMARFFSRQSKSTR